MGFGVEQVMGLAALLVLIPFIIVYLIKPRPVKMPVPSLVFFMKKSHASTKESLFRVFQRDYLFFIQLAILLLLAFSVAYPYYAQQKDVVSKNLVFVLDVSASSNTVEQGGETRFQISIDKIRELTTDTNTLILAKSSSIIALNNVKKDELLAYLNRIKPSDDESRIGDAMLLAGDTLKDAKGRVIVLSDFINTKGVSVSTAKDILTGKGITVDLIDISSKDRSNIGIVDVVADEESTTVYVKNFNKKMEEVKLDIDGEKRTFDIEPGNMEPFTYKTKELVSNIKLENQDNFKTDNLAYVSNPAGKKINVVYVSNKPSKFLAAALKSNPRVNYTLAEPPVIPMDSGDVYVFGQIDPSKILPGTFEQLAKNVANGKKIVITAYDGINGIDFKGLSNVKFSKQTVKADLVDVIKVTKFSKDVSFGTVKNVYNLSSSNGEIIAETSGVPVLVYSKVGNNNGKVVYYGISEKESSFHLSPDYPVFWNLLLKDMVDSKEMQEVNLKTGMSYIDENGDELVLDKIGIYNISGNQIAVNLANEKESNINSNEEYGMKISNFNFKNVNEEVKDSLLNYFVIAALLLALFEIYYVKRRGTL